MNLWKIGLLAAVGLPAVVGSSLMGGPAQNNPEVPKWLSDYEAARTVARDTGKPLFVIFR